MRSDDEFEHGDDDDGDQDGDKDNDDDDTIADTSVVDLAVRTSFCVAS